MTLRIIQTEKAPKAIGPYSQAVQAGNLLFLSGQLPIDPKTQELNLFNGNVAEQAGLVLKNIKGILSSQGLTLENAVKVTIFLSNMDDFSNVNEVYATFFKEHKPARSCVQVSKLPKGAGIEIEVTAVANTK
jgi:2-iminobutanoate/2-iminopropanoate deaminase